MALTASRQDLVKLEQHYADTTKKATDLQDSYDRLHAQSSQQKSTLEVMHRDTDCKIAKLRQEVQSTLQSSQSSPSQLITLQKENHELSSRLGKAHENEDKLKAEKKACIDEERRLQREMAELRATSDADLSKSRSDAATANKQLMEHHNRAIEDLNRRLSQAEAALKKSESDARLSKDQHMAKIASDQKIAASKLFDLESRYQEKIKVLEETLHERPRLGRDQETQTALIERALSEPNQGSKNRKRVSRLNESVPGAPNQLDSRADNLFSVVQVKDSRPPDDDSGVFKSLFEDPLGSKEFFDDEPDLSMVGQADFVSETQGTMPFLGLPGLVPETQDVGALSMSQHVFKERLARASQEEQRPRDSSSVDFSSIASEDLIQLQREAQPTSRPMLRGRECSYPKHGSSQKHVAKVSSKSESDSVAELRSSQSYDRPRSQANTASRMMPPEHNSHRSQSRNGNSVPEKVSSQHSVYGQASRKFSSSNVDTTDLMHSKSSVARQTHSQHDPWNSAESGSQRKVGTAVQDRIVKRKVSPCDSDRDSSIKKPRNSSQADRSLGTADQRPHASKLSVPGSRSKAQNGPPYARGPSSSSRPKASITSSVQPRTGQMTSSKDIYSSRQRPSSQAYATSRSQDSPARQTRSKSRKNVSSGDIYTDRFDEELGRKR
ncbi:Macoilin multi-domain protein [Pyrenophora tritici-repentis]|nr:Macoilin multi-domain protein [Pyrenophora tritici-repentis]